MSLLQKIDDARIQAMKAKDTTTLSTLRIVLAALKNKQIDTGEQLTDEQVQQVVASQVKQLKDASNEFAKAGRDDLVEANQQEVETLLPFLPEQLSEEEIRAIVEKVKAQAGADAQFGQLMGMVMKEVAGRADGNTVRSLVQTMI